MVKKIRWSTGIAAALVVALAGSATAAVTWGNKNPIPLGYSWNYSNSLDFTGAPGTASFKLHDAFISDAKVPNGPEAAYYTSSRNGTTWAKPKKVSGKDHAEGSSLGAAGDTVVVGWFTGFSFYDPEGTPRVFQVNFSTDAGATWRGVQNLTPRTQNVDYPIVAAAKTSGGPVNLYGVWTDADTGKVKFRMKSGGGAWSAPIVLGSTSASDNTGMFGYANIAATDDLITVAWIADNSGTLKARAIDLNGNANAAKTVSNWTAITTLNDKISMAQNGYPIVSASPLVKNKITIAYNTNVAQKYTTFNGTAIAKAGKVIWNNGTLGGRTYTGGYSTVAEPAPGGGIVASWGACKDTASDCNYNKNTARFDLLASTSGNGTDFTAPKLLANSDAANSTLNDEPSIVVVPGKVYLQYNGYTASYSSYDIFSIVGTGNA